MQANQFHLFRRVGLNQPAFGYFMVKMKRVHLLTDGIYIVVADTSMRKN